MSERLGTVEPPAATRRPSAGAGAPALHARPPRRALERSALWQVTRARVLSFLREPEVAFWVFAFPVLMALALGIAFRTSGTPRSRVGVEDRAGAAEIAAALARSSDLEVLRVPPAQGDEALARGK